MSKPTPAHAILARCFYYAAISLLCALAYLYLATSVAAPSSVDFFFPFASGVFGALAVYTERLYDLQSEVRL